eukprot:CAMPEP_0179926730 /NCGR_PEP_ID=MMETSP0983-20121128/7937_1 /TAXON_ID=483367 /ORGANISM="non described non described, Strain CCMP 2436" /LENGTH=140 /DNA_ID=CAMNT_0021830381 /DNA_START=56 /DNA_END=478 /DNA_ORIENTATION=+
MHTRTPPTQRPRHDAANTRAAAATGSITVVVAPRKHIHIGLHYGSCSCEYAVFTSAPTASCCCCQCQIVEREGEELVSDTLDARQVLVDAKTEPRPLELVALGAALGVACHTHDHALKPARAKRARRLLAGEDGHPFAVQ